MNLYFVSFSIFALLITQVTLHITLRLGKENHGQFHLFVGGIPFVQLDSAQSDFSFLKRKKTRKPPPHRSSLRIALHPLMRKRVSMALHWIRLSLWARIGFSDACQTVLTYQALVTLFQSLQALHLLPSPVDTTFTYHFGHEGSQFQLQGIVTARLGSLLLCALTFVWLQRQMQKQTEQSKEVSYATPH